MQKDNKDYIYDVVNNNAKLMQEDEVKLKELIKENYLYLSPLIDQLYYVEANLLYLNYVHEVPQVKIAEIFNITQYGVSKRIVSALKRLSIMMNSPELDNADSYEFLSKIVANAEAAAITSFYNYKTVTTVSKILRASQNTVTKVLRRNYELLELYLEAETAIELKRLISHNKLPMELDNVFFEQLSEDYSKFLVTKHKIKLHYDYLKTLKDYNSRGSHTFRKDWE